MESNPPRDILSVHDLLRARCMQTSAVTKALSIIAGLRVLLTQVLTVTI